MVAEKGLAYEDVRASLRKRYRQRLATGAWRDFHTHLLARLPYINPTPAAEAKLLAQRAEHDQLWREKRAAVHQRRLGEGEALAARAGSGRGCAEGTGADVRAGSSAAAQQAAAFMAGLMAPAADAEGADSAEGGARRAQVHAEHKTGSNERSTPETQGGSNTRDDEAAGQRAMELQASF